MTVTLIAATQAERDNDKSVARYSQAMADLRKAVLACDTDTRVLRYAHELAGADNQLRRTRKTLARALTRCLVFALSESGHDHATASDLG